MKIKDQVTQHVIDGLEKARHLGSETGLMMAPRVHCVWHHVMVRVSVLIVALTG